MNSLIQPYSAGVQAAVTCPLYDPREARFNRQRFGRDPLPLLDRANSLYIPTGRWPTRGWFLIARSDYDQLNRYATNLRVDIGDPTDPNNIATISGLVIVQAQCVTRGIAADPNALYLAEVTDARGLLANEWFQAPLTAAYNIRAPAYPQTFQPSSMNGGTTWTWATMLQNLWESMTPLGTWPGLPAGVTITGTPEGWWFTGVPAWKALCDVLDYLGLTVACDLTSATPFTIVRPGDTDTTFGTLEALYTTHIEDDQESLDIGAGRIPGSVVVLFRRRNSVYGTEETVTYRNDATAKQWDMSSYYSVTASAPGAFSAAPGVHHIWSDFTVRYDDDSNPLAADILTATAIAQERVDQYFAMIFSQTLGNMDRTYTGALPFTTGSQIDGVQYYMTNLDGGRYGWKTRLVRGATPPWPDVW